MFQRIGRSDTLRKEVAEYIKKLIADGRLKPGDRLPTEREMAERFGVSRTVIRDAVKTLSGNGLLSVQQGRGIFVNRLDSGFIARQLSGLMSHENDTISQIFEVRMILETAVVSLAAQRHTAADMQLLLKNLKAHQLLAKADNISKLGQQDREFHLLLAETTHNPLVIRLMKNILDLLEVSNNKTLAIPGRAKQSVMEHERIIEAIKQGNCEDAKEAMQMHLHSIEDSLKANQQ